MVLVLVLAAVGAVLVAMKAAVVLGQVLLLMLLLLVLLVLLVLVPVLPMPLHRACLLVALLVEPSVVRC